MAMYSPKINEAYIPYLYRLARHLGMPMTHLVDQILEPVIERFKENGIFEELEKEEQALNQLTAYFTRLMSGRKTNTAEVIELLRKIA
jgi:hypothetical protein